MRKQPVMDELIKLQLYIKRFCPELPNVKFSNVSYLDLSQEKQDELIAEYVSNIKALASEDAWIN
jgi:hypothetical protein